MERIKRLSLSKGRNATGVIMNVQGVGRDVGMIAAAVIGVMSGCQSFKETSNYPVTSCRSVNGVPCLTLPFLSGEDWVLTRGYGSEEACEIDEYGNRETTHCDYEYEYYDDLYALDFALSGNDDEYGCERTYGQTVVSVAPGTVSMVAVDMDVKVSSGDNYGYYYGNVVRIDHGGGYESQYSHLSEIFVAEGEEVGVNTHLGEVGATGNVISYAACSDDRKRGSHLHFNLYYNGESILPEPLSGVSSILENYSYDREGDTNCSSCFFDEDDLCVDALDDETSLNEDVIQLVEVSPSEGSVNETEFVWVSIINSVNSEPNVTLYIYNSDNGRDYPFEMSTLSEESPWVFTYRKTLTSAIEYPFWVQVENDVGWYLSDCQNIIPSEETNAYLEFDSHSWGPTEGIAGTTEFMWQTGWVSGTSLSGAILNVVNVEDTYVYSFNMDVWGNGDYWTTAYEKVLQDPRTYTFWVEVKNNETTNTSEVGSVKVQDPPVLESPDDEEDDNEDTDVGDTEDTDEPEDTGFDDTDDPVEVEYTAQDCLEDASGVSVRIWMDESNVAPSLNGSIVGVSFNETAGYGGELVAVLEMPSGDTCLNEQGSVNVAANGTSVVSWDLSKPECGAYAVFNPGTVMNIAWYLFDGIQCESRASDVGPLSINNDGSVSWL